MTLEEQLRTIIRSWTDGVRSKHLAPGEMASVVTTTSTLPLSKMTTWERVIREELWRTHERSPQAVRSSWRSLLRLAPSSAPSGSPTPTWLDLCHGDGHVRERALHTLSGAAPDGFFLALVARRLNDWVPQVRTAARGAWPRLAGGSNPAHVVDALCAVLPVSHAWRRIEASDQRGLSELVATGPVVEALRRRIVGSSAGPMASVLSQVLRHPALDRQLSDIAREAIQPAVRAVAHRALLRGTAMWPEGDRWRWTDIRYCEGRVELVWGSRPLKDITTSFEAFLLAAAEDRSPRVRRVAAEYLIRETGRLGAAADTLARRFAADPAPSVASRGAFALRRIEEGL